MLILLFGIAFGVNFMGYEQLRANSGFFVPLPTQQDFQHTQPKNF